MPVHADDVLGLFAKWPRPGAVKTRLAAETSPEFAARLADAFLRDALRRFARIEARRVMAFDPPEHEADFAARAGAAWQLTPQRGSEFGERLTHFFAEQFATGAHRVVVVGADSPTLPIDYVNVAFELVADHDVVLGPAADGGYYLIGLRRSLTGLFADVHWGGSNVLAQTVARLHPSKGKLALLPPWYDVDTLADWHMLRGHLAAMRRAGIDPLAPHTEAVANDRLTPPL